MLIKPYLLATCDRDGTLALWYCDEYWTEPEIDGDGNWDRDSGGGPGTAMLLPRESLPALAHKASMVVRVVPAPGATEGE